MSEPLRSIGIGEASEPDREMLGAAVRQVVRYADPAAWVVATAICRALGEWLEGDGAESTSVIVVSELGPRETMDSVAQAALEGYSSPMRYPAANPGSLAGVSCIAFGFRGGALNLTMPASSGVEVAVLTAGAWLRIGAASRVALAVCRADNGQPGARAMLLGIGDERSGIALDAEREAWLCGLE